MSYQEFNILRLRKHLKEHVEHTSYREIEEQTRGALKRSNLQRIVTEREDITISDVVNIMKLLGTKFSDYIVERR